MYDVKAIDARIRKLQKVKEVLADEGLRELIADSELLELMREAVGKSGNGNGRTVIQDIPEDAAEEEMPAVGSLKRKVVEAALALPGKFNSRDIVEKLQNDGHQFQGRDPMIAVNQALRIIALKRKFIRLVRAGSGRIPHIYEAIRRENATKN
jgi:hypothetical protein